MRRAQDAVVGIWEFIAGDDWMTAAGVVAALGLTALVGGGGAAWIVMPVAVAVLLVVSVWRATRKHDRD